MITKDFLPNHPSITIYQDDEMFRINTDTQVLGEFLKVYKDDTILDMGTNTGALLLYASLFKPKKLIGIDINEKALKIANQNLIVNNVLNYELINANIIDYKGEEVDVIICNPPYFKTKPENLCTNQYLAQAKHENDLTLEKLIFSIRRNLKNYGTLYLLYLTSRLEEVMITLRENKFKVKILKFVYDKNKKNSNVVLIKAVKGGKMGMVVEKPIIIER